MKQKMWVMVNIKTGKLVKDIYGGVGYATRKTLVESFDEARMRVFFANPNYKIRKIEIEV